MDGWMEEWFFPPWTHRFLMALPHFPHVHHHLLDPLSHHVSTVSTFQNSVTLLHATHGYCAEDRAEESDTSLLGVRVHDHIVRG